MTAAIECWFDFASPYSYLAVMRIESAAAGVSVVWKPFLLGAVFKALGWSEAPFIQQKEKGVYMWKDLARQCEKHGLPWRRPDVFPRLAPLPLRVTLLGEKEPWIGAFCRGIMALHFASERDVDINSEAAVAGVLDSLGQPAGDWIGKAKHPSAKQALKDQTEAARSRGVFGAPTFFVEGEMFWGNDRLDDALAFAARGARA